MYNAVYVTLCKGQNYKGRKLTSNREMTGDTERMDDRGSFGHCRTLFKFSWWLHSSSFVKSHGTVHLKW